MDKWYDFGYPVNRREELRKHADRREPCSQHWMYNPGTSAIDKWSPANKDWPYSTDKFMWRGNPVNEAVRARAINRTSIPKEPNFPPFTSHMTTTYRKPVYSVFGPLQRDKVYGITQQHNRHGHMPFEDYYWQPEVVCGYPLCKPEARDYSAYMQAHIVILLTNTYRSWTEKP